MNKKSFFSGIALVTALGLGTMSPVGATSSFTKSVESTEQGTGNSELLQKSDLIAARRCYYKKVYHKGYYSRRLGIIGRKRYHPGYYTTKKVCY